MFRLPPPLRPPTPELGCHFQAQSTPLLFIRDGADGLDELNRVSMATHLPAVVDSVLPYTEKGSSGDLSSKCEGDGEKHSSETSSYSQNLVSTTNPRGLGVQAMALTTPLPSVFPNGMDNLRIPPLKLARDYQSEYALALYWNRICPLTLCPERGATDQIHPKGLCCPLLKVCHYFNQVKGCRHTAANCPKLHIKHTCCKVWDPNNPKCHFVNRFHQELYEHTDLNGWRVWSCILRSKHKKDPSTPLEQLLEFRAPGFRGVEGRKVVLRQDG